MNCIWQNDALLGEGPLWVARENSIYWLDILQNRVHRLDVGSGERRTWHFAEPVTSLFACSTARRTSQKPGFLEKPGFSF